MIIALGTGHGKSIIIQVLADLLINLGKKHVLIVCINEFLAYYARSLYGT